MVSAHSTARILQEWWYTSKTRQCDALPALDGFLPPWMPEPTTRASRIRAGTLLSTCVGVTLYLVCATLRVGRSMEHTHRATLSTCAGVPSSWNPYQYSACRRSNRTHASMCGCSSTAPLFKIPRGGAPASRSPEHDGMLSRPS